MKIVVGVVSPPHDSSHGLVSEAMYVELNIKSNHGNFHLCSTLVSSHSP